MTASNGTHGGATWAVVGANGGHDEFERKARIFISQQSTTVQPLLQEVLSLRSFATAPQAQAAGSLAASITIAAKGATEESIEKCLAECVKSYSLSRVEDWWDAREWRMLQRPLAECLLNCALDMKEMLTEERADVLRKIAAARSRDRIAKLFKERNRGPLSSPNGEWRKQLGDWQVLLEPYPWNRVRPQVINRILTYAQLQEPLTQHARLVKSYEFLRCLGPGLVIGNEDEANSMEELRTKQLHMLSLHGEIHSCWSTDEINEAVLSTYLDTVVGSTEDVKGVEFEGKTDLICKLGYSPQAVRGNRQPGAVLAQLTCTLITRIDKRLQEFCESRGLRGPRQACQSLLQLAQEVSEQSPIAVEELEGLQPLRNFLLVVATEFMRRSSSAGPSIGIDFGLLVAGDPRMEQVRALEEQANARSSLDDMAHEELLELLKLIVEASEMVHSPGIDLPGLEPWVSRVADGGKLYPDDIGKLSAALQDFIQQNCRNCKLDDEDILLHCVVRALGSSNDTSLSAGADSAALDGHFKQASNSARRVVACFGANQVHQEGSKSCSPIVVRAVPLRLSGSSDDYEVREVGVRIGGMYRPTSQSKAPDDSAMGSVQVMHYEWVPPGEVREDSKPLEQILSSATHVRIVLPEGDATEEREVDLQSNRVHSDSAWYRVIPSRPRTSADDHSGFRRFVVEVGRGLRLPLPNGLLQMEAGTGVMETADVLAQLLSLWFSQKHSREDIGMALRHAPALLYFASTALFECFDHLAPNFMGALESHWASVLGMQVQPMPQRGGREPLSVVQHEARQILLELLTARPVGRLCAVLPPAHLNELCMLTEKTRHSTMFLAVERFCFESALERIRAFQDATITLIIIDVTGQISALQLGELVRCAYGSIRLILNWYPGLLPSLAATRSLGGVIVPASVESDVNTSVSPTAYREKFALGAATLLTSRIMVEEPMLLSPLAGAELLQSGPVAADDCCSRSEGDGSCPFDWMRNFDEATQHLVMASNWIQREVEWRNAVHPEDQPKLHEALLLIVTADEPLVRKHYESLPEGEGVQCFSLHHSDRQALTQIEAVLDRTAASWTGAERRGLPSGSRTIIVLFNVGFVAPSKLEDIIARAYLGGQRVVLIVQEPSAALRSVRVSTRRSTQYVHATILSVRNATQSATSSGSGTIGLRALRLVLGQDAIPFEQHATLVKAFESEDIAACTNILQPSLKPETSSNLVAGVLQVLPCSSKIGLGDSRSLAFAVGCLAAKFIQTSLKLDLDQKVWDISFPDFRAYMPICRFLDQVSVLEAWCRYLDFTGAVRLSQQDEMLPEGLVIWPQRESHQHFILSHWIVPTNAHSTGIEDLLEHAAPRQEGSAMSSPPATYFGTGPGHHSEAHEDVIERHCLQRREMDWAQFSESWRTALDIKPDVFLQLAAFGVDTLRLFLCLPPERAIELGLTHLLDGTGKGATPKAEVAATVAQKLLRDLECVGPLLEVVVSKGAHEVAARFAAVKWLLLTILPERDALSMLSGVGRIDEDTVEQLVRAKVMLAPRGRTELLRRVVAIVVGLDGGDVLGTQHEIRRFLLDTRTTLPDLLCDSQESVGRAIVAFLFSPDHTEQLKRREKGRAVVESFERMLGYDILRWKALEDPQVVAASKPHLITAAAHAAIIERAPGPEAGQALADGPLLTAVSQLAADKGGKHADSFLTSVLDDLPNGLDTLVLVILETLASQNSAAAKVMATLEAESHKGLLMSAKNKFLPELFAALRTQDLGDYLMMVADYKEGDTSGRPLQLALDRVPSLCKFYTEHFHKMNGSYSDSTVLNIHNSILDDSSCTALFTYLSSHFRKDQPSDIFLLWYCWSRSPDKQLPIWAWPREEGMGFTQAVNGSRVPFVDRCRPMSAGLSVLANYVVAAETLNLGVYNTLAEQVPWIHSDERPTIESRTVLIGQEDCPDYSPYFLRWHSRALPKPLREKLIKKCQGSVEKLKDANTHDFYPRIEGGVSEYTFKYNLALFMTLTQDNTDLQMYFDHGSENQRHFVAMCICCWFKAAGFEFENLHMCVKSSDRERFKLLWNSLHDGFRRVGVTALRRAYVSGALPHAIDVHWVGEGVVDVPLFARTRNSALVTAQSLNMLIVSFDLADLEAFTPEDLVQVTGPNGGSLVTGRRFGNALASVSSAIGCALHRDLLADVAAKKLIFVHEDGKKIDSDQLVNHIAVLADFASSLRSTPGNLQQFFSSLVRALVSGAAQVDRESQTSRPSDLQLAVLFDCFFLLFGITPNNEGREIEELTKAYHANHLPLSSQALEEIRWLHEHYYGRRNKSTDVIAAKFQHFSQVCELLQRIRNQTFKTVAMERTSESIIFIGDLLYDESIDITPPYLQELHFPLICSCPSASKTGAKTSTVDDDATSSAEPIFESTSPDLEFFTATGEDTGMPHGGTGVHWHSGQPEVAEVAWQHPCPVVSAPDIVEMDASESFYLHAVLRVRAGLQPILWCMDSTDGFYRISSLLSQRSHSSSNICKAFSTNADAWQFIDRAQSAVVMCDGFYLRKGDDGFTWLVIFPAARPPDDLPLSMGELSLRHRRCCIWPLCHSHKLVNLAFNTDTLRVLQLLVWIAWYISGPNSMGNVVPPFASSKISEPLRELSTLSNLVECSMASHFIPEGDEELVDNIRRISRYQKCEQNLAEVLLRIMTKMKTQHRDDLGGLIRSESQRRTESLSVPFIDGETKQLSDLGVTLQHLLVPIVSKAAIAGCPVTTKSWTQLELVLEACFRGDQLPQERCFAKHMHITKSSFAKRGTEILRSLYQSRLKVPTVPTVQFFSDSEDEDEDTPPRLNENERTSEEHGLEACDIQYFEARSDQNYIDTLMDRDTSAGTKIFDQQDGFGRPLSSRNSVLTFYDEDLPLYFVSLNRERLKIRYSASEGMCLGYLLHKNVFSVLLEDAKNCGTNSSKGEDGLMLVRTLRNKLLLWIADVLRSPLPNETKTWILRCCERMGMVAVSPYQEANHVNLAVIAYCLCRCCPSGTEAVLFLRNVLMNAWHIPEGVKVFIERKADIYGLYIVKSGTLQMMQELGLHVAVRNFEREVWQRSMNNSAMYLDIISHFSSYCCFIYVQALPKIDDILLKWLAEYTRLHPWRFIILEGVDTSFNFPENRDRCNFRFAPPNPLHTVKSIDDLRSPYIAEIRPSHTVPYPESLQPTQEQVQDSKGLFTYFSKQLGEEGSGSCAPSLYKSPPAPSSMSSDFREELEQYLFGSDPCLVLLVSAPGAGKTHHMSALRGRLEGEMQFDIHEFDGSSDILVTTALSEVLQRTIQAQNSEAQKLLILDEYHMLSDEHKDELFEWVRTKLGPSLRVVLICNRIDSKDRQRLEQARPLASAPQIKVGLIQTRISRKRVQMVMEARGNAEKWRDNICDWIVGSRYLFGEESVSLRLCDTMEEALQRPDPRLNLIDMLLHRVPTISRATANEFVAAYLQHIGMRSGGAPASGLVAFCFKIAMLDREKDELCSFVEFLERTPRAHEAIPAVRLLAWCIYMMGARQQWDISLATVWGRRRMFVDQVNFPFELTEESMGSLCSHGPTFSWAGDPTSLRDLVDAVKRGHSVDWADVYQKVWSVEHIKDSELFAQLLSSSRNPAMILQRVLPANLCSLLRLSNTPAPTAVQLARIILKHAPHSCEGNVDRPRCLAMWTLLLHDQQASDMGDILRLVGSPGALLEALLWARDWATDRRATVSPAQRTKLLQQALVLVCVQDQVSVSVPQLALLWTGSFGQLLRTPTLAEEELWAKTLASSGSLSAELLVRSGMPCVLPLTKLQQVIQQVADVQEDWMLEVQALWRIGHSRTTAREVSSLWSVAPHLLQDPGRRQSASAEKGIPVNEYFINGIVTAPGTLSRSLQHALLCNNCKVPESITPAAFSNSCADALNEMRNADQLSMIRVGGPLGSAIQNLVEEEMTN